MGRKFFGKSGMETMIPVVYARNITEAKFYQSLLEDQEITVAIEVPGKRGNQKLDNMGIAVKVPEEDMEEAQAIIDQRHGSDDDDEYGFVDYEQESEFGVDRKEQNEKSRDMIIEKEAADEDY